MKKSRSKSVDSVKRGSVTVRIYRGSRVVEGVRYPLFTLSYYDSTGKRVRKTFADHRGARTEAEATAAKLSRGQGQVLTLTNTDRQEYLRAVESLKPLKLPLSVAVDDFIAARTRLPEGVSMLTVVEEYARRHAVISRSVPEVVSEMLEDRRAAGCSLVHLRDLELRLKRFSAVFKGPVGSVTSIQVREYLRDLKRGNGNSAASRTKRNCQTIINSLFHFARKHRYILRDAVDEICEIEPVKTQPAEIRILTPEQIRSILVASKPELTPVLAIGAFCGLRTAELQRLEWREVKLDQAVVIVGADKAKTASRRIVPIPENCMQWIGLFLRSEGRVSPASNDNALGDRFERTAFRAGIKWVRNGLRHSFCSYRLAVTHDPARVATEAGNSPNVIHRHYKALVTEKEGQEWFSIFPSTDRSKILHLPAPVARDSSG